MVKRRRNPTSVPGGEPDKTETTASKIASLLALIAIRDMDTEVAALRLDAIGFSAREISALLDVGPNYVNVARHRKKDASRRPRKKD